MGVFTASGKQKIVPLVADIHIAGYLYPLPASQCPSRGGAC